MKRNIKLFIFISVFLPTMLFAQSQIESAGVDKKDDAGFGSIRGLIKPVKQATLSSEISARVTKLPYKVGASFKKGSVLINFDCSQYAAELDAAKAEYLSRTKRLDNNRQLLELNAISKIEVDISEAEAQKAKADKEIAQVKVNQCYIKAPYDGRVVERFVHEHESVAKDQQLISILDDKELEIELIVPSKWLSWLKSGTKFKIDIDETGQSYDAVVSEVGAAVDPVSQTVRILGKFNSDTNSILPGMSGEVSF